MSTSFAIFYQILNLYLLHKFSTNKNYKISEVYPEFIIDWLRNIQILSSSKESIHVLKNFLPASSYIFTNPFLMYNYTITTVYRSYKIPSACNGPSIQLVGTAGWADALTPSQLCSRHPAVHPPTRIRRAGGLKVTFLIDSRAPCSRLLQQPAAGPDCR